VTHAVVIQSVVGLGRAVDHAEIVPFDVDLAHAAAPLPIAVPVR
jgi:hypothetical protein